MTDAKRVADCTCPAHFGMHDLPCQEGCGEMCIRAEPRKVNEALAAAQRALAEANTEIIRLSDYEKYWEKWLAIQPRNIKDMAARAGRCEQAERELAEAKRRADGLQAADDDLREKLLQFCDKWEHAMDNEYGINPSDEVRELLQASRDPAPIADRLQARIDKIVALTSEQAEDKSLWFDAHYITEDILQKALRRLHAVIEDSARSDPAPSAEGGERG